MIERRVGRNDDHDRPIRSAGSRGRVGAPLLVKIILQVIVAQFLGNRNTGDTENPAEICLDEYSNGVSAARYGKPARRTSNPTLEAERDGSCSRSHAALLHTTSLRIGDGGEHILFRDIARANIV